MQTGSDGWFQPRCVSANRYRDDSWGKLVTDLQS